MAVFARLICGDFRPTLFGDFHPTRTAKKAELKALVKAKAESDKIAAAKKAEEDKAALLAAFEQSGKSIEEILDMLKG